MARRSRQAVWQRGTGRQYGKEEQAGTQEEESRQAVWQRGAGSMAARSWRQYGSEGSVAARSKQAIGREEQSRQYTRE